jgi:predicted nucleic acid-binding protein
VIVVDSSVWIDYFNGLRNAATDTLDTLLGEELIVVGDLILTEVLQGFRSDHEYRVARRLLGSFDVVPMLGHAQAVRCAENYRLLRKRGITVRKTNDAMIATYCITNDAPLLFRDADFKPFVEHLGLRVPE